MLSYLAPKSCLDRAFIVFFIGQHLPDVSGSDLLASEGPADPAMLQNQQTVGGQANTFQDMGRKQERPVLLITAPQYFESPARSRVRPTAAAWAAEQTP